jgi:UDP-N-acetylmuramate dehydrogenase
MGVREQVPLAPCTTLRLGGPAARFADVEHEADLADLLRTADARGEPVFILGGGSNVVVGDAGFAGLVVRVALRGVVAERAGDRAVVDVAAGEEWDTFVARAIDEGWTGVECMSGIPGLAGATPVQNVGAYGQEVSDALVSVRVFDRASVAFAELPADACALGYRTSRFKRNERFVVTSIRLALPLGREGMPIRYPELARALSVEDGGRAPTRVVRETVIALRRRKGMVVDPTDPDSTSAGSFFVNPVVTAAGLAAVTSLAGERPPHFAAGGDRFKLAAAWLVERAGFPKGWGAGAVGVSGKHALALVHRGGGSARELLRLAWTIRDGVRARFGVELEPEPVLVGCSWEDPAAG